MFETIPVTARKNLKDTIMKFDGVDADVATKKELYRVLKVAETQGWTWSVRNMYGGGKEVSIWDGHDAVAYLCVFDQGKGEKMSADFMAEYLRLDFKPAELMAYNAELDAELRNEEALYKYELPRPWIHSWYVQPKRDWGNAS